jgi:hypothetical protein
MITALQSSLIGMQNSQHQINQSANSITSHGSIADGDSVQTNQDIIQLRQSSLAFHASLEIIKSADTMLGCIIDVRV